MDVRLAMGAELDIASSKEVTGARDDILDFLKSKKDVRPTYLTVPQAKPITNPFTGVIEVGSPPTGRLWNVLGYSVCGQDDSTVSTGGTVALYIGDVPTTGAPTLTQLKQARITLPAMNTYSRNVMWCPSAQSVFFSLNALAGLTQFVGNIWVAEYREDDVLDRSGA